MNGGLGRHDRTHNTPVIVHGREIAKWVFFGAGGFSGKRKWVVASNFER